MEKTGLQILLALAHGMLERAEGSWEGLTDHQRTIIGSEAGLKRLCTTLKALDPCFKTKETRHG